MSTLKVDNIQSYAGGDVTLNGNLDVTGIISGDGSGLTNVPGGGGSDLSSYTGSINQTGGNITLDGDFNLSTFGGSQSVLLDGGGFQVNGNSSNLNGGVIIPYINGGQKNLNIQLSGSNQNYTVGGFDFDGKSYGQIYSQANGGFIISDVAPGDTFPSVTLQSDNGGINLRTQTTGSNAGYIINTIEGNSIWRAEQSNYRLTLGGNGIGLNPTPGFTGSAFGAVIDGSYGFNFYNQADFTIDTGIAYNLNSATGQGRNKQGIFANYGATYADVLSWQDANNYTDGALHVHQILKVDGSNNAPGSSLDVDDGTGTPRLQVQNAALKALTGIDVVINGETLIGDGLQLPAIGNYANDGDAAAAGVPISGVYHHNGDLKIRIV